MTILDPLETESTRLLPSSSGATSRGASGCMDCQVSWRWILVIVLSFCTVVTSLDRTILAMALSPAFQREAFISNTGAVLAFFYGFVSTSLVGGRAAQIHGGKAVLLWAVLSWSAINLFTPLAFRGGTSLRLACRCLTGMAEGIISPCIFQLLSTWFPEPERTRAVAITLSGVEIGTFLTLSLATSATLEAAWVVHFYVFGSVGVLWCAFHWKMTSSTPEWHPQISLLEVQHITKDRPAPWLQDKQQRTTIKWRMLTHPALLSIYAVHALWSFVWHLVVAWLPSYCRRRYSLEVADIEVFAALQCAASVGVSCAGGWACDMILKQGADRRTVRRNVTAVGMIVPALGFQFVRFASTAPTALAILMPSIAIAGLAPKAGFLANVLDVAPNHAGVVVAVADICAMLPGILFMHIWVSVRDHLATPAAESAMNGLGGVLLLVGALVFHAGCTGDVVIDT